MTLVTYDDIYAKLYLIREELRDLQEYSLMNLVNDRMAFIHKYLSNEYRNELVPNTPIQSEKAE